MPLPLGGSTWPSALTFRTIRSPCLLHSLVVPARHTSQVLDKSHPGRPWSASCLAAAALLPMLTPLPAQPCCSCRRNVSREAPSLARLPISPGIAQSVGAGTRARPQRRGLEIWGRRAVRNTQFQAWGCRWLVVTRHRLCSSFETAGWAQRAGSLEG